MPTYRRSINQASVLHNQCMCCGSTEIEVFYEIRSVPVNSVLLLNTLSEALCFRTRDITLGICRQCGFISNVAFDESVLEYSSRYESTQSWSPTFNNFSRKVAKDIIARFGLQGKKIIEIGCGQGEFLTTLCEMGENYGVGFDPAYIVDAEAESKLNGHIKFVPDFYSNTYADYYADIVICKMTLEHVHDVSGFVKSVRNAIGHRPDTVVFFQVPNSLRILDKGAIWDIYYEHCSYFSPSVLAHLFARHGFEVLNVWTDYEDQYVLLEARVTESGKVDTTNAKLAQMWELKTLVSSAVEFAELAEAEVCEWNRRLDSWEQAGLRGVIWGGGSKAVAFLSALRRSNPIAAAVDINPKKHGTFLPVSGLEVVAPEFLIEYQPDFIIIMNSVYVDEIRQQVNAMGINAHLVPLD